MALKALRAATQIADFLFGRELLRGLLSEIGFSDAEIAGIRRGKQRCAKRHRHGQVPANDGKVHAEASD